jgi:protein O-mannosyl-transferase
MPASVALSVGGGIDPIGSRKERFLVLDLPKVARCIRSDWFRCLFLGLITIIVHSPALSGQRIWDDDYLSRDNPFIKSPLLILETFRHHLFFDSLSAHYRPVQNISFIFDYFFWNTDEFGFHLTNLVLHASSGILLYFLLRYLLASFFFDRFPIPLRARGHRRAPWISNAAFLVSLIWIVHPVHSAAVDYISGRADSLAFFFAAAGWLLFVRAQNISRRSTRLIVYGSAMASGLVALLSREIACVWFAIFIAHLCFVEKRFPLRFRVSVVACCLGLIGIYAGMRQLPEPRTTPFARSVGASSFRAILMARALGDYGRLMVLPANLHMERTVFDSAAFRSKADWRTAIDAEYLSILGLLVFTGLVFGSVKKGRAQAVRIFGASWFLVAYLPISNIISLNATVAEHWLYLPSVGFLIFLFGCAFELPLQYRQAVSALALLATLGLSVRSFVRSSDWANEETFYTRTFAAGGTSTRVAVNLGQIYANRRNYAEAERIFRGVLEQTPDYPIAQNNLAGVLYCEGKTKEAEALYAQIEKGSAKTRREYPRTWIGALNLAAMRHQAGDNQSAFAILGKARNDYPEVWELISYQAEILRKTNQLDPALRLVEDFAKDHWWHYRAALALGRLYAQKGETKRAENTLHFASSLDVHDAEALHAIAQIRLNQNRLDEAFETQQRAITRQPYEPRQYILLSNILEKMGRDDEARAALAKVSQLHELAATSPAQSL